MSEAPKVYAAIAAVMEEIGKIGMAKKGENKSQNFKFRGIDQVYAALNPLLAKHHLVILPRAQDSIREHLTTARGGNMNSVVMPVEFDLVSALDGSKHTIRAVGEAQDMGDKASMKAMSLALKNAVIQAFMIPIEGVPDGDAETPEPTRARISERDKAQLVVWRNNVLDAVARAESDDELTAIQKAGDFKRYAGMLDEAGVAEIKRAFADRRADLEPPLSSS